MLEKSRGRCKNVTISLPHTTIKMLRTMAKKGNMPLSRVIDTLIQRAFNEKRIYLPEV